MTPSPRARSAGLRSRILAHPRYPTILLVTCLVGMFSTTFTATILSVSIGVVAKDLHSTPDVLAWVVTAPALVGAVALPILGRMGDMRGHRRVFLVGFTIAIVFNLMTGFAWSAASIIAFRTLGQLAGSATIPASFAMLFDRFAPEERVRASSWASGVLSAASVSGLAIGGVVIDSVGWRPLFVLQALLGLTALIPAFFVLAPDGRRERVPLDRAGAAALAVVAFSLAFGLNRAAVWGLHPVVLGLALLCPIGVWVLVKVERRARAPLVPLELLRLRNVKGRGWRLVLR